ncbi:MAG: hypothetical protein JWR89_3328, partial [Tardiphaga sp.]|nr:hypothetical protein [Tardiphaga sp.]
MKVASHGAIFFSLPREAWGGGPAVRPVGWGC